MRPKNKSAPAAEDGSRRQKRQNLTWLGTRKRPFCKPHISLWPSWPVSSKDSFGGKHGDLRSFASSSSPRPPEQLNREKAPPIASYLFWGGEEPVVTQATQSETGGADACGTSKQFITTLGAVPNVQGSFSLLPPLGQYLQKLLKHDQIYIGYSTKLLSLKVST